jgi:stress response protein YsnF
MRNEGDTTIIPVLREVVVVQKRYEIVEEIRITKRKTERTDSQQVTLRKEEVHIERSGQDDNREAAH